MPTAAQEVRGLPQCEVCGARGHIIASSLPDIPMTVSRCVDCVEADAVPLSVAVAHTALIGGIEDAADWWQEVVASTLDHLDVSREYFDDLVAAEIDELEDATEMMQAERRKG